MLDHAMPSCHAIMPCLLIRECHATMIGPILGKARSTPRPCPKAVGLNAFLGPWLVDGAVQQPAGMPPRPGRAWLREYDGAALSS